MIRPWREHHNACSRPLSNMRHGRQVEQSKKSLHPHPQVRGRHEKGTIKVPHKIDAIMSRYQRSVSNQQSSEGATYKIKKDSFSNQMYSRFEMSNVGDAMNFETPANIISYSYLRRNSTLRLCLIVVYVLSRVGSLCTPSRLNQGFKTQYRM